MEVDRISQKESDKRDEHLSEHPDEGKSWDLTVEVQSSPEKPPYQESAKEKEEYEKEKERIAEKTNKSIWKNVAWRKWDSCFSFQDSK